MNDQVSLNGISRDDVFRFGGPPSASTGERIAAALERLVEMFGSTEKAGAEVVQTGKQPLMPQQAKVASPYLNAEEAAAYLRLDNVKQLYGLIERGKLRKLPGYRNLLFTTAMLDEALRGK